VLRRTIVQLAIVTVCCATAIYLLRDVIIAVVLTAGFAPIRELLPFQLVGDVFKVVDYPLQMVLVTQRRVGSYIAQAVGGPALYVSLNAWWGPSLGAQAAPVAYATSSFIVMLGLLYSLRHTLVAKRDRIKTIQEMQTA
jgi:hypothetical protein